MKRWAIKNIEKIAIAKCLELTPLPYSLFLIPYLLFPTSPLGD
jgi:hypothetical protein